MSGSEGDQLRRLADELRTQLATVQRDLDVLGRAIREATHHSETVTAEFSRLDHQRTSISAGLVTAFDEMEKIDVLILAAEHEATARGHR